MRAYLLTPRLLLPALIALLAPMAALAGTVQVLVLDREGKPVPDAVVVLRPSAAGAPAFTLPRQVTINQEKMRFVPAVALVAQGAKATFVNNDPWEHHVRASPAGVLNFDAGSGFELRLDGKAEGKAPKSAEAVLDKPGAVLLGCHLHASMRGHVYVSDSPWAMLTDAQGVAAFERVPDGPAFMRVWQADQLIDLPPQELKVSPAPMNARVQLSVVPRRRRV
jgi:plastocyanin